MQMGGAGGMIKSMTGFGRGEAGDEIRKIIVEIKSVNHRYLDLNVKLPRKLNAYEVEIRNVIKSRIVRGKVDVFITLEETKEASDVLHYNTHVADMYMENLRKMSQDYGIPFDVTASSLARFPDVLEITEAEEDDETLHLFLMDALTSALDQFVENRTQEGMRLQQDLLSKMDEMSEYVSFLEKRSPMIVEEYRDKLHTKVAEMLGDTSIDENRIAAEVVIYADKVCIDEEMVRLRSHVDETRHMLSDAEEVGRKLDFIAQEMNREANTILSKSTDVEIAGVGISLKTLIEKVREQIQNLE